MVKKLGYFMSMVFVMVLLAAVCPAEAAPVDCSSMATLQQYLDQNAAGGCRVGDMVFTNFSVFQRFCPTHVGQCRSLAYSLDREDVRRFQVDAFNTLVIQFHFWVYGRWLSNSCTCHQWSNTFN